MGRLAAAAEKESPSPRPATRPGSHCHLTAGRGVRPAPQHTCVTIHCEAAASALDDQRKCVLVAGSQAQNLQPRHQQPCACIAAPPAKPDSVVRPLCWVEGMAIAVLHAPVREVGHGVHARAVVQAVWQQVCGAARLTCGSGVTSRPPFPAEQDSPRPLPPQPHPPTCMVPLPSAPDTSVGTATSASATAPTTPVHW